MLKTAKLRPEDIQRSFDAVEAISKLYVVKEVFPVTQEEIDIILKDVIIYVD